MMHNLLPAGIIASTTTGGVIVASSLTGQTSVSLEEAAAVFVFVMGIVLYQDRKNAAIKSGLNDLIKGQVEINRTIRHLPCHPLSVTCPKPDAMKLKMLGDIQKLAEEAKRIAGDIEKEETTTAEPIE